MTKKDLVLEYLKDNEEVNIKSVQDHLKDKWFVNSSVDLETVRTLLNKLVYYGRAIRTSTNTYAYKPKVHPVTYFAMNKTEKKSLSQVIEAVCRAFEVDKFDLLGTTRKKPAPDARKAYCYLTEKYTPKATLTEVGKAINKDHSTVVYSRQMAKVFIEQEKEFRSVTHHCEDMLDNTKLKREKDEPYSLNDKEIGYYYNKPNQLIKHYDLER